ncbi:MAG TPA: hypothetical protein VGP79_11240 [Bryobacteraceae bacterium]|jgi:hypothetical protein|nr:hypothetical protein [Bryobacteraceae bacterium]
MTDLFEKALERVAALPEDAQDAIAAQILETLEDEDAKRFRERPDLLRALGQEAIEEHRRDETRVVKRSLASIAGKWQEDPEFDLILEEQRQVHGVTGVTLRAPDVG